jgi:hypothetical protein
MVRLLLEVGDHVGPDVRSGRDDELVVRERLPVGQMDQARIVVDAGHGPDDEVDAIVEEAPLGLAQGLRPLVAHRDVHEAGLVDVYAQLVDDGDAGAAVIDPTPELAADEVRGERAADATAEDEDAIHLVLLPVS